MTEGSNICMCHVSKMTSVWRALVHLSKSYISICALQISGFAGLAVLHLSNPAVCICRHAISTLRLEHRWISPNTMCVFSNSNHLHLQTGDLSTFVKSLLFSSLLINQNSFVRPIFTQPFPESDGWLWMQRWSIAGFSLLDF